MKLIGLKMRKERGYIHFPAWLVPLALLGAVLLIKDIAILVYWLVSHVVIEIK